MKALTKIIRSSLKVLWAHKLLFLAGIPAMLILPSWMNTIVSKTVESVDHYGLYTIFVGLIACIVLVMVGSFAQGALIAGTAQAVSKSRFTYKEASRRAMRATLRVASQKLLYIAVGGGVLLLTGSAHSVQQAAWLLGFPLLAVSVWTDRYAVRYIVLNQMGPIGAVRAAFRTLWEELWNTVKFGIFFGIVSSFVIGVAGIAVALSLYFLGGDSSPVWLASGVMVSIVSLAVAGTLESSAWTIAFLQIRQRNGKYAANQIQ